jgi:glucokinase
MTKQNRTNYILAGDIGGTKTSLALYEEEKGPLLPLVETTVKNDTVSGLDEIITSFLQENNILPRSACFGVAGPVINNRVRLTNRDWTLDGQQLQQKFDLQSVVLINDLVATAMGAVHLPGSALHTLNGGQRDPQGSVAVLAPGTGLGEAFLIHSSEGLLPCPSEGGHCLFSPADARQTRLLRFLQQEYSHVTAEQVCSGSGMPNLYAFLKTEITEPPPLAAKMKKGGDEAKIIVDAALEAVGRDAQEKNLPVETLRLFAAILASEAANLVLKVLATGGLYIGGGIPPRILPFLRAENFMASFSRGVYRKMLARIPVHIILEPKTPLFGAAAFGISMRNQKDTEG